MTDWIDLNADLGEGSGNDTALMKFISSANIACGGHAGDSDMIARSIELALENNVAIGAHPGFADKENFGRKRLDLPPDTVAAQLAEQIDLFQTVAKQFDKTARYVKLHGALANMAAENEELAKNCFIIIEQLVPGIKFLTIANSAQTRAAQKLGFENIEEAFADRAYTVEGLLTPRHIEGAVLHENHDILTQIESLASEQRAVAITGELVSIKAQSICLHGDNKKALALGHAIREKLLEMGLAIKSFVHS